MDYRVAEVGVDDVIDVRWRVLRPGLPRETAHFAGDDHPGARHWAAVDTGGQTVGCVTMIPAAFPSGAGPAWQLRGMAVDGGLQGRGVGALLLAAVRDAIAEPAWCNARLRAVPFYERHGWAVVSDTFEIAGVGPHQRMIYDGGLP